MKNSKLHLPQKLLVLMLSVAMMVTWTVPSMYAFATDEAEGEEQAEVVENVVETEDEAVTNEETAEEPAEEEAQEEAAEEAAPALKAAGDGEEQTAEFAYDSGSGTESDPGVISSAETLAAFATEVDNGNHTTDYVKLGADIDLSGIENWNPIGYEGKTSNTATQSNVAYLFNGDFNGAGHKISGLNVGNKDVDEINVGLFSALNTAAKVYDLTIDGISINISDAKVDVHAGGVAGEMVRKSTGGIYDVKVAGSINVATKDANAFIGGVVGRTINGGVVSNATCDVDLDASVDDGKYVGPYAGGIAGSAAMKSVVVNCASTGDIKASEGENSYGNVGGVAGMLGGSVINSYASGSVTYTGASEAVGLAVGYFSYATAANMIYYASEEGKEAIGKTDNYDGTINTIAMAAADMAGDTFASTLNKNLADAIEVTGRSLNKWVVSDGKAVPEGVACSYYDWLSLYKTKLGLNVSNENNEYDAVTSATNFASGHVSDIPPTIAKTTDAEGENSLTGVMLPVDDDSAVEVASTGTARAAYYDITDQVTKNNKKYGTDKLTVYLDNTKEGYTWNDYSKKLYAVTVSDGTTTIGTLPWIDFYVEGHHTDYVDLALNNGKVHEGVENGATVNRFAAFYDDNGFLKAGTYTVTLYAVGYKPLSADVLVDPVISSEVTVACRNSKSVAVSGLPEDMKGAKLKVGIPTGKKETQVGEVVDINNGKAVLTEKLTEETSYNFTITSDNYADVKLNCTAEWTEDSAKECVTEAEEAVKEAQEAVNALTDGSSTADVKAAYEALVKAQNAVTEAQADLTAAQEKKLNAQITDLTEQLAEATIVDISNFAVTLDGVEGYSATYTGKAIEPVVAVAGVDADKYTFEYANNTNAGEATVTITATDEAYKGTITKTFKINKAANGLNVKATAKKVKVKKVKKKKQTVAPLSVSGQQGAVTYKKASGSKKLTVASNGKVTVKKGTKKGTYKAVVAVTAAGDANHAAATKKVTVKVKVK